MVLLGSAHFLPLLCPTDLISIVHLQGAGPQLSVPPMLGLSTKLVGSPDTRPRRSATKFQYSFQPADLKDGVLTEVDKAL